MAQLLPLGEPKSKSTSCTSPSSAAAATRALAANAAAELASRHSSFDNNNNNSNQQNNLHNLSQFLDTKINQHRELSKPNGLTNSMGFKLFTSELLGTFFLVYLSQTALTSFELLGTQNDIINRRLVTILSYGLAYLMASLVSLNLSGAHLNPSYSTACAILGRMRWTRAISYSLAQYLGAFLAALFLHATYSDKLAQRHQEGLLTGMNSTLRAHGNILSTGKFFSSFPPTEVSLTQLNISYFLATAMLTSFCKVIHKSNIIQVPRSLRPVYLAVAHSLIMAAFAANGGPVFNPAQDFSPRFYIYLFGWGSAAFNPYNYKYWWLSCIVAPHLGALIGLTLCKVLDHLQSIQPIEDDDCYDDLFNGHNHKRSHSHNHNHVDRFDPGALDRALMQHLVYRR